MKFSFESQEYRDNLAEEVTSLNSKVERRELLEKKKNTLEYVLAQHIKDFERKTKGEEVVGNDEESGDEKEVVRKEVEVKLKPSDPDLLSGPESYTMELEIVDISDQIPLSVKIIQDMHRLLELGHNHDLVQHRDFFGSYQNYHILKQYVEMMNAGRTTHLLKEDGTQLDEDELDRIAKQAQEDYKIFLSQVTEGSFDNPYALYHTIGAHTKGWTGDGGTRARSSVPVEVFSKTLTDRFPHQNTEGDIEEKPIEIGNNLRSPELWVHHDTLIYDSMIKPLMIMDASSYRFRHEARVIAPIDRQGQYEYSPKNTWELEPFLVVADTKNQSGGRLCFWHDTPWLLIADQIVDPYHGRLIKIREKNEDNPSIESQYSKLADEGYKLCLQVEEYKRKSEVKPSESFNRATGNGGMVLQDCFKYGLSYSKLAEIIPKLEKEIETVKKYLALLKEFPEFAKKELSQGEGYFPEIFKVHGKNPRECIDVYEVVLRE